MSQDSAEQPDRFSKPKNLVPQNNASTTRRRILSAGACTLGVGVVGSILAPAIRYLTFPVEVNPVSGDSGFFPVGKGSRFSELEPTKVDIITDRKDAWSAELQVKVGSAWVMRKGDKLIALSSICPHLGCFVDYNSKNKKFFCPCHKSSFALDGSREEGPSPRDLDLLEVREENGLAELQFQRFKLGQAAKEPLG